MSFPFATTVPQPDLEYDLSVKVTSEGIIICRQDRESGEEVGSWHAMWADIDAEMINCDPTVRRPDVVSPGDLRRDDKGRVIGCGALVRHAL